ncbi:Agenet domain containing protein [Parasponia andersonii]|uniref:Agenet domain containing protein n=1 Tax=Parasponia andersonii TaxID=3476 RepID=A0A2P5CA49_PARAD|nr:Agenet domain containing protein [Parasponia andersonii]
MGLKKGSKVEVLCKKEVPFGAWRCAEIVSGDGRTYNVRYESTFGMANGLAVERVPRTAIRPCPPSVESVVNWAYGDIVEVLDSGSWKIAVVSKVLDADFCLVRLLGSLKEFMVHKSKTRWRKTWQDDKWVVFGKAYDSREVANSNNFPNLNCCEVPPVDTRIKLLAGNDGLAFQEKNYLQDSYIVSARSLKRSSPFCSSFIEAYPSKVRAIEKRSELQQVVSRSLSPLLNKVDAVASPRDNLGENDMHASFVKQTTGHLEKERENIYGASSCFIDRSTELSESDSDACSVGSCSVISNRMNNLSNDVLVCSSQDADTSDAESFCGRGDEEEKCPLSLKENEESRIHRLELHAYHSTLVAMHASGPLSWEQEALLTNLRITLHISNDEHLTELRNLISSRKPSSLLAYNQ